MHEENFEQIWALILLNEGQVFQTKQGILFTYQVIGNTIHITDREPHNLSKKNFFKAITLYNPNDLKEMNNSVRGSSYVWGIFHSLMAQIDQF